MENNFTPEEAKDIEQNVPAIKRKHKIKARHDLTKGLSDKSKSGGISSPLNPLNPGDILGQGEPTKKIGTTEIDKISDN
ncbi:MAG: hypothetical protein M1524_02135 [Patescibacteria group bacterium]|nr:hypothetical protein [Patescibacteria group bacterium]